MAICSRCTDYGLFFVRSCFGKHTTILMPLDTAGHTAPILNAFIENQETEDRVREERALLHERYNSNVVNHRSPEVLLLHFGATVFYGLSCLRGIQALPKFLAPSSSFLNSDRAEQFRRCFPQYVRSNMPGCRRGHMLLKSPVLGLEDT